MFLVILNGLIILMNPSNAPYGQRYLHQKLLNTKDCPEFIKVHNNKRVYSDECMACMACVEACPVDNTLEFNIKKHRMNLSVYGLAVVLLFIFFSFVSFGRITGNWENSISTHEYMVRIKDINNPLYDHNRGRIVTDESIIKQ